MTSTIIIIFLRRFFNVYSVYNVRNAFSSILFFFVPSSLFPNSSVSFRHLRNCLCVEININISIFFFSLAFFLLRFGLVWCHKFMSDCYIFYVDLYIFTFYNKREYLRAIIVDIKYFHTYLFHSFLVIVFALSWRFLCSTDSTQENKKRHFVFFRQFSSVLFVFPFSLSTSLCVCLCVFFLFRMCACLCLDSNTHVLTHRRQ